MEQQQQDTVMAALTTVMASTTAVSMAIAAALAPQPPQDVADVLVSAMSTSAVAMRTAAAEIMAVATALMAVTHVKTCTKCNTTKPVAEFFRQRSKSDGYRNCCKLCFSTKHNSNHKLKKANRNADPILRERERRRHRNVVTAEQQ